MAMPTVAELSPADTAAAQVPAGRRSLVEQLVARSITLSVDPMPDLHSGAVELARLAGHDQSVLGRAWLEVVVPALRRPNRQLITAERFLAAALNTTAPVIADAPVLSPRRGVPRRSRPSGLSSTTTTESSPP